MHSHTCSSWKLANSRPDVRAAFKDFRNFDKALSVRDSTHSSSWEERLSRYTGSKKGAKTSRRRKSEPPKLDTSDSNSLSSPFGESTSFRHCTSSVIHRVGVKEQAASERRNTGSSTRVEPGSTRFDPIRFRHLDFSTIPLKLGQCALQNRRSWNQRRWIEIYRNLRSWKLRIRLGCENAEKRQRKEQGYYRPENFSLFSLTSVGSLPWS